MEILKCALALLSGVIGAGFASGREIVRFFAGHGSGAGAAVLCAVITLCALFIRLPAQLERAQTSSISAFCSLRFGERLGKLCAALFLLLMAVTGGAMLAACAELFALTLPVRHAYVLGLMLSLCAACLLAPGGVSGLALPGAALLVLLPALLVRLLALPGGETGLLSHFTRPSARLPFAAAADGVVYGALNAAMLAGSTPMLLTLSARRRRCAALVFSLLFGLTLSLAVAVCLKHLPAVREQPLPFVYLSRGLGRSGYLLLAASLYAAALSTLCAMLAGMLRSLPYRTEKSILVSGAACLLFAVWGFEGMVCRAYPVLGALCAGLLFLLCLPLSQNDSSSVK